MKIKFSILFIILFGTIPCLGQLTSFHNRICAGDTLVKQQVEYIPPGEAEKNKTWDFRQLQVIKDRYTIIYSNPPLVGDSAYIMGNQTILKRAAGQSEFITGNDFGTMYYYCFRNDTLSIIGHENPVVRLEYPLPYIVSTFPLNYGDNIKSAYIADGLYSGSLNIKSRGNIHTEVDAYGKMVLPSGDTISPVLRIKTTQTIFKQENNATVPDSINDITSQNKTDKKLEIYKWYTKGYRYPIFETIHNMSGDSLIFATAFFLPPQEQLYIRTDSANQVLLDNLWNIDKAQSHRNYGGKSTHTDNRNEIGNNTKIQYTIYPNPVESELTIEYAIKNQSEIAIFLLTTDGRLVFKTDKKRLTSGSHLQKIDFTLFPSDNYLLRITGGEIDITEKIIKK